MSTLYILELEKGKYYVGKTDNLEKRFEQHKNGQGSEWTRTYKPIKMLETRKVTSSHDENNVTKDFMKKYGIENVRGGSYCQVDLPYHIDETIRHELRSNDDKCFKCGKPGHFANQCKRRSSFEANCCGKQFFDFDEFMNHTKGCKTRNKQSSSSSDKCYRCGRKGHWSSSCYARTDKDGNDLDSDDSDYDSE